jgi:hypothetical protein
MAHFKYCLAAFPFVLVLLGVAFWGVWEAYQASDDATAPRVVDNINLGEPHLLLKCGRLLGATLSPTHWAPISTLILYPTIVDDTNRRIVSVNLLVLMVASLLAGCLARTLGADFWPALFCSLWVATAQVLVLAVASCWGAMNMLEPVLGMGGAWVLWRWLDDRIGENAGTRINWQLIWCFTAFVVLAMLTRETGVRWILAAGCVSAYLVGRTRSLRHWREMAMLFAILTAWIVVYFALRYFLTEADIPLVRTRATIGQDYHLPRLAASTIIRNAATILTGSLNVLNSYEAYLCLIKRAHTEVFLRLLPAASWGVFLLYGSWIVPAAKGRTGRSKAFVLVLAACSLFPESLLGKVSETYAMASLWPLAILSALVLTDVAASKRNIRWIIVLLVCLFLSADVISTRQKVDEILATGENAHQIRRSMIDLTRNLPDGCRIAVIRKPRPQEAFARFGLRGIQANESTYLRGNRHKWSAFDTSEAIPRPAEFDLILKESEDQRRLEIVAPEDLHFQKDKGRKELEFSS